MHQQTSAVAILKSYYLMVMEMTNLRISLQLDLEFLSKFYIGIIMKTMYIVPLMKPWVSTIYQHFNDSVIKTL